MSDTHSIDESLTEPAKPIDRGILKRFFLWLNVHSQLVASIASFATVVLLSVSTYFTGKQTKQSAAQFGITVKQMGEQIDQAAFALNYQEFTYCVEQLDNALNSISQNQNNSNYEPVTIQLNGDSLVLRLNNGSESPFVVDEISGEPVIRVQIRGSIPICLPTGGSEPAFQVADKPERLLTHFQRAKMLEKRLGESVVASQYLTLARFSLVYSGFKECEPFLRHAVKSTKSAADIPGQAMVLAQMGAMRVKYEKGKTAEEGRNIFRQAVGLLHDGQAETTTVSLVSIYQAWAEAELRAGNINEARDVTELLFNAVDLLPIKQTIKNQYIVDAATKILIEMEMSSSVPAELRLPIAFRMPTVSGEWKSPTADHLKSGLNSFEHNQGPAIGSEEVPAPIFVE